MSEHPASDSRGEPTGRRGGRGRVWPLRLLLALIALACVLLWLAWRPKVPVAQVRLTRGADGRLMPVDDSSSSGFTLEFHVGGINASNSLTTTSSESGPSQARFACRRLAIFNESDHLLMQRVGANLLTQLDDLKGFQQVQYYPYGVKPEPGELAPDVTVSLQLDEISSSGFAPARKLNAQVRLTAASTLLGCPSHYYSNGLNPPAVEFDMTMTLDHQSTSVGIGTPSARYKLAAADISKQLSSALTEKLNALYRQRRAITRSARVVVPAVRGFIRTVTAARYRCRADCVLPWTDEFQRVALAI